MKLILKNIGKIDAASIEINGITVIAGENNSGKSTVGKALYCLFAAFQNINEEIQNERKQLIYQVISIPFRMNRSSIRLRSFLKVADHICENREEYLSNPNELEDYLDKLYSSYNIRFDSGTQYSMKAILDKVLSYLQLDDNIIKSNVLKKIFMLEYDMQIGHVNFEKSMSSIKLEIHGEESIDVEIIDKDHVNVKKSIDIYSNVVYIEDPFVIDELASKFSIGFSNMKNHRTKLIELLVKNKTGSVVSNVIEELAISEKLNHIFEKLNQICEGGLVETEDSYEYVSSKYKKPLSLFNISTGFKTFLILKTLLLNGAIEEGGTIILDEPEIHLHPEWQLVFAELIVLLQKKFGIHVLLNTHSPYFLRAIQVYSEKYEIDSVCKYYLSENNGEQAIITDETNSIEKIYAKLARPLQKLEDERWQDD